MYTLLFSSKHSDYYGTSRKKLGYSEPEKIKSIGLRKVTSIIYRAVKLLGMWYLPWVHRHWHLGQKYVYSIIVRNPLHLKIEPALIDETLSLGRE